MSSTERKTPNRINDKLKRRYVKITFLYHNIKYYVSSVLKISDMEQLSKITSEILQSCLSVKAFMTHIEYNSYKDSNFSLDPFLSYTYNYLLDNYNDMLVAAKFIGKRPVIRSVNTDLDEFRKSNMINLYTLAMEDEFLYKDEFLKIKG